MTIKEHLKNPKVSVIVTTFNREVLLKETIDSILKQTFKDFELIVVDNFSEYDFLASMSQYDDFRIRIYQNQNDGVIAANRNFGIKKAKGEFLAFCDDDDLWHPTKLEKQFKYIIEENADLVHTNMYVFQDSPDKIINQTKSKEYTKLSQLIQNNQIYTSTVMVRGKEVKFPEDAAMFAVEDYSLWLKLLSNNKRFKLHKEPLVYYRLNPTNTSKKYWATKHIKNIYVLSQLLIAGKSKKSITVVYSINVVKHIILLLIKKLVQKFKI